MTKVFCDICKKEIECDSEASEYKMKESVTAMCAEELNR